VDRAAGHCTAAALLALHLHQINNGTIQTVTNWKHFVFEKCKRGVNLHIFCYHVNCSIMFFKRILLLSVTDIKLPVESLCIRSSVKSVWSHMHCVSPIHVQTWLCKHDMSHLHPEVHNVSQCCRREEDQAMAINVMQMKLDKVLTCNSWDIHSDRQIICIQTSMPHTSQYFLPYRKWTNSQRNIPIFLDSNETDCGII